jgi:hypothetical protein
MIKGALLVAALAALATAGGSYAFFASHGTGSGTATAGAAQSVTLTPAAPTGGLYPGGSADVALTVSNPSPGAVVIPSLTLDTARGTNGFAVDTGHAGCDVAALSFTLAASRWTVPAQSSAFPIDLPAAISMSGSAANACQGATFTVYLKVGS